VLSPLHDDLRSELIRLLEEPLATVQKREQSEFDRRVGSGKNDLLLFGAGNLGRRVLATLRNSGQDPVGFIDNNPALWGHKVEGLEVFQPTEAAKRFVPNDVAILTTIWCGEATDKMADRIRPLQLLGFKRMALFGHLAWKYPERFLPHYSLDLPSRAIQQADRIVKAFDLLKDRRSREIFLAHVHWRLHLDYDGLPVPVDDTIYFNKRLIRPLENEFLIDGGAFTGDTIESFLNTFGSNGFRRILSFEPDPNNFAKLEQFVKALPEEFRAKTTAMASALGDQRCFINVETSGGPSSRVGHGSHQISCDTIDEVADREGLPTFIKLDIEGYEPQALRGAARSLKTSQPVVTACVYHVQDHLWEIPLAIHEVVPDYHYYFVPHLSDGWDLVLYSIPEQRLGTAT
jgi:FkbM family methyltransferase